MFLFQVNRTAMGETGKTAFYLHLEKWANSKGIPITISPDFAKSYRPSAQENAWGGAAIPHSKISERRIVISQPEPSILLHEAAHQFLMVSRGFVVEHYMDMEKLRHNADSLEKIGPDSGFMKKNPLKNALNRIIIMTAGVHEENYKNNAQGLEKHEELNQRLYGMVTAEAGLAPAIQAKLEAALGKPQHYPYRFGPKCIVVDVITNGTGAGYSRIGNILDESSTFRLGDEGSGHPMTDYHEFFASMSTALTLDGQHFFEKLDAFASIAKTEPGLSGIFQDLKFLLSESLPLAREFRQELVGLPGGSGLPELANLGRNLGKLEKWLGAP